MYNVGEVSVAELQYTVLELFNLFQVFPVQVEQPPLVVDLEPCELELERLVLLRQLCL